MINQPTNLPTYQPTNLPTYQPTNLPTYIYIYIYFLCMHNTLVHAQHSCACTGGARAQGQDPTKKRPPGPARGAAAFLLGPGLGPWPLQCMHKRVVHAQECCACTRNKYRYKCRLVGW